jgi:hydroxyethylthiazole kinase
MEEFMDSTINTCSENAALILETLRREVPLVQIITNYVTVNDVANALLCLGASPAMVEAENEVRSFLPFVQALYLNTGTLTKEQAHAMRLVLPPAKERGIPVLLDPVACGVIKEKMDCIRSLLETGGVTLIKGNSAEILSLAGRSGQARGVDALTNTEDPEAAGREVREACTALAKRYSCTVAATGEKDFISDGTQVLELCGGSIFLTRFSGSGCITGGLMAACAGALGKMEAGRACTNLHAALTAAACMKCASEEARRSANAAGPMSFKIALLDTLAALTSARLKDWVKEHCVRH